MAESASTASASSGGPGAKGGSSSGAWWKSLTSRKKTKETLVAAPGAAWPLPAEPVELLPTPPSPSDSRENQQLSSGSGSRRNLKISRSGRFKEKRKVRATLLAESPQKLFEGGGGGGNPSASNTNPALPTEETPSQ